MSRGPFDALDDVPAPDQWDEITRRGRDLPPVPEPLAVTRGRGRGPLLAVAGLAAAALVHVDLDPSTSAGDDRTTTSEPGDTAADTATDPVVCAEGGVDLSSIPDEARWVPYPGEVQSPRPVGQRVLAWQDGEVQVRLHVPAAAADVGPSLPTTDIGDDRVLWQGDDATTHLAGPTPWGDAGGCGQFRLSSRGGTGEERTAAVEGAAEDLRWDPGAGLVDCGTPSTTPVQVAEGPSAASLLTELDGTGVELQPAEGTFARPAVQPDGHCELVVELDGGLVVTLVASGRDGAYALDRVIGMTAPTSSPGGTEEPAPTLATSLQRQPGETRFTVDGGYWCDDCARAELRLHYPDDDIRATATITGPEPFTGDLPRLPSPDAHPVQTVVYRAADGTVRGLFAIVLPGG